MKKHKDVEYQIDNYQGGVVGTYGEFEKACVVALTHAVSNGESTLNVLVYSKEGAKFYGGGDAVEQYKEDPEASVFERFEIKVNAMGRVP